MADKRKLQGEIDRCLKRVVEGVEQFEDVWQKVHNASNANQKEKYEADLKKEIKKLQRLRDQIKTWLASNDIKDKRPLMEKRKLIETQMERFKVVERETKTKAYSKEGLGLAAKVDPAQKEKEEVRQWLTDSIDKLQLQIDQFESEVESVYAGSKKKKLDRDRSDRVEELQQWVDRHKFHIQKLEAIMRMMDNCTLETDAVKDIMDDLNYYVESNQEPDFTENEMLYDDMDLEDVQTGMLTSSTLVGGTAHPSVPDEDLNSIPSSPSSSQGPLSPKTPTAMKSTSQELFEERRRGKTTSISEMPNDTPPQPAAPVPPSPRRLSAKSLLQNVPHTSRTGPGSGGGADSSKATTPTSAKSNSLPSSKTLPLLPQQPTTTESQIQRGITPQTPSGAAYSIAAGGNHNAGNAQNTLPQTASTARSATPPIPPSETPTVQSSTLPVHTSSVPVVSMVTAASSIQQGVSSHVYLPPTTTQPSTQPGTVAQPRPQGPGSHQTHHSRSSSGSSSLSLSTLSQDSFQPSQPSPAPHQPTVPPATAVVMETAVPQQQPNSQIATAPSEITVETRDNSQSTKSSSSSPDDALQPPTPPPFITSSTQHHQLPGSRPSVTDTNPPPSFLPTLPTTVGGLLIQPSEAPSLWALPVQSQGVGFSDASSTGFPVPGSMSSAVSQVTSLLSLPSTSSSDVTVSAHTLPESLTTSQEMPLTSLSSLKSMAAQVVASNTEPVTSVAIIRPILDPLMTGTRVEDTTQARTDMQLEPLLGVTPLGPVQLNQEKMYQLKMLEGACKHLPQVSDSERVRPYLQRTPYPTPYYHHLHPPPHFDSFDFFQRLSIESLFFIFYYMEGTKAQYMAAKALKRLSWRFHTKYMMWFQRLEEPKAITDDYEMGTYIYFDFEKWSQRKKEGFTFEYRYLEDKDLP